MTSELLRQILLANLALSAAIVVAIALRGLVRRRFGARMAYGLWLVAPLAVLAVFAPQPAGLLPSADPIRVAAGQAVAVALDVVAAPPPAPSAVSLLEAFVLLWLAGFVVAAVMTFVAHSRGMASFGGLAASGRRGVVRASKTGLGPAMVGVWRPRLVLPVDFETRFTVREQALILAHEDHHRASGDTRINGLVSLVCCLNWFNPLVHLAARLLRVDQELACDAAVVERFPGERRTYAEALLKTQLASTPMPLGCHWPSGSSNLLQERLTMLAFKTPGRARLAAGSAIVGLLCLGTAAAAWAASGDVNYSLAEAVVFDSVPAGPAAATNYSIGAPAAAQTPAVQQNPGQRARTTPQYTADDTATPSEPISYVCLSNGCAAQQAPAQTAATSGQGAASVNYRSAPPPPPPAPPPPPPPPFGAAGRSLEPGEALGRPFRAPVNNRVVAPNGDVTLIYEAANGQIVEHTIDARTAAAASRTIDAMNLAFSRAGYPSR